MFKNAIKNIDPFYQNYVNLVKPEEELIETLEMGGISTWRRNIDKLKALGDLVYDAEKWTIRQMVQHIIDTERIFSFRALAAARREVGIIPGYNEDAYAVEGKGTNRNLIDLIDELETVRKGTWLMYRSFEPRHLEAKLNANNVKMDATQLGFILIGHARHHFNVVEERYFPLID